MPSDVMMPKQATHKLDDLMKVELRQLDLSANLNLSLSYLKLGELVKAIEFSSKVMFFFDRCIFPSKVFHRLSRSTSTVLRRTFVGDALGEDSTTLTVLLKILRKL